MTKQAMIVHRDKLLRRASELALNPRFSTGSSAPQQISCIETVVKLFNDTLSDPYSSNRYFTGSTSSTSTLTGAGAGSEGNEDAQSTDSPASS